jgi:NAD(P)H-nitrite reductase large subunit
MVQEKMIICRCEEVTLGELVKTIEQHLCSSRELKLRTRAGMGYCGGRTCRMLVDTIFEQCSGQPLPHNVPLKYQPPVRPISFGDLGKVVRHGE